MIAHDKERDKKKDDPGAGLYEPDLVHAVATRVCGGVT